MTAVLASIPSPSSGALTIGPLSIHAYGLMIALGVIAAVWLLGRRLEASGARHARRRQLDRRVGGDRRGHRLPALPRRHRLGAVQGTTSSASRRSGEAASASPVGSSSDGGGRVGVQASRHRSCGGRRTGRAVAAARPGHRSLGQLVEPGALRQAHDPALGAANRQRQDPRGLRTGHHLPPDVPVRVAVEPGVVRACCCGSIGGSSCGPGRLFAIYVVGYAAGRFWVEGLRIDFAHTTGGLRLNQWVALVVGLSAIGYLVIDWARHRGSITPVEPAPELEPSRSHSWSPSPIRSRSRGWSPKLPSKILWNHWIEVVAAAPTDHDRAGVECFTPTWVRRNTPPVNRAGRSPGLASSIEGCVRPHLRRDRRQGRPARPARPHAERDRAHDERNSTACSSTSPTSTRCNSTTWCR